MSYNAVIAHKLFWSLLWKKDKWRRLHCNKAAETILLIFGICSHCVCHKGRSWLYFWPVNGGALRYVVV
jgi:hypothetical protein